MSPIRVHEAVRCGMRRRAQRRWALMSPVIRDGRVQQGVPAGTVREFAETDYCYGVGPLTLLVRRVEWSRPVPYEGDTWLEVQGVVIDRTGRTGALRQVLVRAGRLPTPPPARKRPRLRP